MERSKVFFMTGSSFYKSYATKAPRYHLSSYGAGKGTKKEFCKKVAFLILYEIINFNLPLIKN